MLIERPLFITWRGRQGQREGEGEGERAAQLLKQFLSSCSFSSPPLPNQTVTEGGLDEGGDGVGDTAAVAAETAAAAGRDKKTLVSCRIDCFNRIEIDIVLNHCVNTLIERGPAIVNRSTMEVQLL